MIFFSVVTPSWNQAEFLGQCLESVASQDVTDFEHIVFDNCSDDRSSEVAARFPHVDFRRERDRGQSDAVNKGFAAARGEIICWLNSDDAYPAGTFEKVRVAFENPDVHVIFGDALQVTPGAGAPVEATARFDSRLDLIRWWSPLVKLHQPAVFFRKSVLKRIGGLREDLHFAMDYEFWWRMSGAFEFRRVSEPLAIQHRQVDSKTVKHWDRVLEERERIFSPHYGLVDGGDRRALLRERDAALAEFDLLTAWTLPPDASSRRQELFLRAVSRRPAVLASTSALGLLKRIVLE